MQVQYFLNKEVFKEIIFIIFDFQLNHLEKYAHNERIFLTKLKQLN